MADLGLRLSDEQVIIDVDPRNFDEDGELARLVEEFGLDLDNAPKVETSRGGAHYYFSKPATFKIAGKLEGYPGFDFKAEGSYVVAPGSIHDKTNEEYVWDEVWTPQLNQPAKLPEKLCKALKKESLDRLVMSRANTPLSKSRPC